MALPVVAAAVGIAGQIGTGIYQSIQGGKMAKQAQNDIDAYVRQDITNYAENLRLTKRAQDWQAQQTDQSLASVLDVVRQGGSFTNATALTNQAIKAKAGIAATIEKQEQAIENARVEGAFKVQQLQEKREQADLEGLGAQLGYGLQMQQQGYGTIGSGFGNLAKLGISQGQET